MAALAQGQLLKAQAGPAAPAAAPVVAARAAACAAEAAPTVLLGLERVAGLAQARQALDADALAATAAAGPWRQP